MICNAIMPSLFEFAYGVGLHIKTYIETFPLI